jgi:hypothetical protein
MTTQETNVESKLRELRQIVHSLCSCCTTTTIPKKHGRFDVYEDEKIVCSYDTYFPNLDVYVKLPDGSRQLVWMHTGHGIDQEYHPGKWEAYLLSLKECALGKQAQKDARRAQLEQQEREERRHPAGSDADAVFDAKGQNHGD